MPPYNYHHEPIDAIQPSDVIVPVNASLLKRSSCERAMHMIQVGGYKEKVVDDILATGTALHKYYAILDGEGDEIKALGTALAMAPKDPKTQAALRALFMARPRLNPPIFTKAGQPFIEQELVVPWRRYVWEADGVQHNKVVVLYGTLDRLILSNNILVIQDYKTSLYYKTEDALRKYNYEIQFEYYKWLFYNWAHLFLPLPLANLARDCRLTSQVLIAQLSTNTRWTIGPMVGFTPAKAELIESIVEQCVEDVILPLQLTPYAKPNGMLSNSCGYCQFKGFCHAPDERTAQMLLEAKFDRIRYGPKSLGFSGVDEA